MVLSYHKLLRSTYAKILRSAGRVPRLGHGPKSSCRRASSVRNLRVNAAESSQLAETGKGVGAGRTAGNGCLRLANHITRTPTAARP
jgi:hypothetical protein